MKPLDSVIFCDNHILIATKPANLLTQPDAKEQDSMQERAKLWVKKKFSKPGAVFLHPIHRLDKPVSGLLLFARTSKALSRLNEASRAQEIQRGYTAEVEGIISLKEGRLDHYLIHKEHRAVVGRESDPLAKHARLTYEVKEKKSSSTIVQIELETGRYHQIRAQFGHIGHPIVHDRKYGAKQGGDQIHLHCSFLGFIHPVTKEELKFTSPTPF